MMRSRLFILVCVFLGFASATAQAAHKHRRHVSPPAKLESLSIRQALEAGTAFEQAVRMLKGGRVAEARVLLHRQLKDVPTHLDARRLLVQLLLDAGFSAEAEALLAEGQRLLPQSIDLARSLAVLQAKRGATALALATLEKSRSFAQGNVEYLGFMAGLCQDLAKHDQALVLLEEMLVSAPDHGGWLYAQWVSRRALGDFEGARASAEKALASGQISVEQSRQIKAALRREAQRGTEIEDNP